MLETICSCKSLVIIITDELRSIISVANLRHTETCKVCLGAFYHIGCISSLQFIQFNPITIVCSPPLGSGGGTIFGKFSSRRGNVIFEEAGGGQLQGVESRFPNHMEEELSRNQKLVHETLCFKQFRAIFRSK